MKDGNKKLKIMEFDWMTPLLFSLRPKSMCRKQQRKLEKYPTAMAAPVLKVLSLADEKAIAP